MLNGCVSYFCLFLVISNGRFAMLFGLVSGLACVRCTLCTCFVGLKCHGLAGRLRVRGQSSSLRLLGLYCRLCKLVLGLFWHRLLLCAIQGYRAI